MREAGLNVLRHYRAAFAGLPAATWLLALVAFVNRSGSMVVPFLSLYLIERHQFTVAEAGAFVSLFGVGSIGGNALGGVLADRFGAVRTQVLSLLGTGAAFALLAVQTRPWAMAACLVLLGVISDAFRPGNMSAVAATCGADLRSRAFALNRLAINAGWAIGPALGGFLAKVDYLWLFAVDGATSAAAGVLLLAWARRLAAHRELPPVPADAAAPATAAPAPPPADPGATPRVRTSPLRDRLFLGLLLCTGVTSFCYLLFFALGPLWLHEAVGLDKAVIGVLLALNPAVITATEMVLVHRLSHRPPLQLVIAGSFLLGLGMALMPLWSAVGWLAVTILVWTVGEMLQAPTLAAYVGTRAPAGARGRYLGAYGTTFSIAWLLAPLAGTQVYQRLGADAVWYGAGVCGLLGALGFWALARAEHRERR